VDDILKHADAAMYRSKADGRNTSRFYLPDMQAAADERLALEKDLRVALSREELCLYFQPQVDADGHVIGAEALLRWQHPQRGMVPPTTFIPIAEETGLIHPLGEWVLWRACRYLKEWSDAGFAEAFRYLAVNVSPWQFRQVDFVAQVERLLRQTGAEPGRLALELTEGVVIDNVADTIVKMQALQRLGVHFSMDDFGTGYSSLIYLKQLPLDVLKIDKSFVQDIATDPNDAAIVATIIAMASHLGLAVIAEGVETDTELDFLYQHGCHAYQGYYFSRPLPAAAFQRFLAEQQPSFAARA
jgi:EAL domain-containing protein (putative c-di-GMP-specific phosphodiesterase class I)